MSLDILASRAAKRALAGGDSYIHLRLSLIWARLLLGVGSGWERWPQLQAATLQALGAALEQNGDGSGIEDGVLSALESMILPDDDGTAEWQCLIDLISSLGEALRKGIGSDVYEDTVVMFLENVKNSIANRVCSQKGRSISETELDELLPGDAEWREAVEFVS